MARFRPLSSKEKLLASNTSSFGIKYEDNSVVVTNQSAPFSFAFDRVFNSDAAQVR